MPALFISVSQLSLAFSLSRSKWPDYLCSIARKIRLALSLSLSVQGLAREARRKCKERASPGTADKETGAGGEEKGEMRNEWRTGSILYLLSSGLPSRLAAIRIGSRLSALYLLYFLARGRSSSFFFFLEAREKGVR